MGGFDSPGVGRRRSALVDSFDDAVGDAAQLKTTSKYLVNSSLAIPDNLCVSVVTHSLEVFDAMLRDPLFVGALGNPILGGHFLDSLESFEIADDILGQFEVEIPLESAKDICHKVN